MLFLGNFQAFNRQKVFYFENFIRITACKGFPICLILSVTKVA